MGSRLSRVVGHGREQPPSSAPPPRPSAPAPSSPPWSAPASRSTSSAPPHLPPSSAPLPRPPSSAPAPRSPSSAPPHRYPSSAPDPRSPSSATALRSPSSAPAPRSPSSEPPHGSPSSTPPPLPVSSAPLPRPPSSVPPHRHLSSAPPVRPLLPPPASTLRMNISALFAPPPARGSPTLSGVPLHPYNYVSAPLPVASSPTPGGATPPAAQPPKGYKKFNSFLGSIIPLVCHILPAFYHLRTGDLEKTLKLFGTPAMLAGMVNSILWVLYCIVVMRVNPDTAMLMSNVLHCMASFQYLMLVYAHKRATTKGYALAVLFTIALFIVFFVMHWDQNPSEMVKLLTGLLGLIGVVLCHGVQINDILNGITEKSQVIATAVNIFPSCIMNFGTLVITAQQHPEHNFIMLSSIIGFGLNMIEILFLVVITILGRFFRSSRNATDIETGGGGLPSGTGSSDTLPGRNELEVYEAIGEQGLVQQSVEHRTGATEGYQEDSAYILILQGPRGIEIFMSRPASYLLVPTIVIFAAFILRTIRVTVHVPMVLDAPAMLAGVEPNFALIRELETICMVLFSLYRRSLTDGRGNDAMEFRTIAAEIYQREGSVYVIIHQGPRGIGIFTSRPAPYLLAHTIVIFPQFILRTVTRIGRDFHVPMVLDAPPMLAGVEPNVALIRELENICMVLLSLHRRSLTDGSGNEAMEFRTRAVEVYQREDPTDAIILQVAGGFQIFTSRPVPHLNFNNIVILSASIPWTMRRTGRDTHVPLLLQEPLVFDDETSGRLVLLDAANTAGNRLKRKCTLTDKRQQKKPKISHLLDSPEVHTMAEVPGRLEANES